MHADEQGSEAEEEFDRRERESRALPFADVEEPAERVAHQPQGEPRSEHLGVPPGLLPLRGP